VGCIGARGKVACGGCPDFHAGTDCQPCNDGEVIFFVLLFVVMSFIIPIMSYYTFNGRHSWKSTPMETFGISVEVLVEMMQVYGVLAALNVSYPDVMRILWAVIPDIDFGVIIPSMCLFSTSLGAYFVATICIPLITGQSFTVYLVSKLFGKAKWKLPTAANGACKFLNMLYVSQITMSMVPMMCYKHPDGTMTVLAFPAVFCDYNPTRSGMLVIAIASLAFCCAFAAYIAYLVWKVPSYFCRVAQQWRGATDEGENDEGENTQRRRVSTLEQDKRDWLVFIIEDFRHEAYWMMVPNKLFEICMAFVLVAEPDSTFHQILLYSLLVGVFGFTTLSIWPFKIPAVNAASVSLLAYLLVFLLIACNYINEGGEDADSEAYATIFTCFAVATPISLMGAIVYNLTTRGLHGEMLPVLNGTWSYGDIELLLEKWEVVRDLHASDMKDSLRNRSYYDVRTFRTFCAQYDPTKFHIGGYANTVAVAPGTTKRKRRSQIVEESAEQKKEPAEADIACSVVSCSV
jgi:hypothetical protein